MRRAPKRPSRPTTSKARRGGASGGAVLGFLEALTALLTSWRPRLTDPLGLALVASLDALLRRLEEVRASGGRLVLEAHEGAVTGLLARDHEDEGGERVRLTAAQRARDPRLAALIDDLHAVVDGHARLDLSREADALAALVASVALVAGRWLDEGGRLEVTTEGAPSVWLVTPTSCPTTKATTPTLSPAHRAMVLAGAEGIERLLTARDTLAQAIRLATSAGPDGLRAADVDDLKGMLQEGDFAAWEAERSLCAIASRLTGENPHLAAATHLSALERVRTLAMPDEVRAHDERTWLTRAHQALTGTDD